MDYEKKYKEAIERAIFVKENTDSIGAKDVSDVIEYIFSELKESESEDEKVRKAAIEFVRQNKSFNYNLGISKEQVIAWLEKQGKSKFEQCLQEGDKIVTNEDGTHFNVSQLERVAKKEPKKVEDETLVIDEGKAEMDYCFTKMMNGEKVSSAWSEEDENKVTLFMQLTEGCDNEDELADWLKSLQDRVKPQWKPSEEQIHALEYQVHSTYKGSWQYKASNELLEQLKKL